jgi:hypothetical protein
METQAPHHDIAVFTECLEDLRDSLVRMSLALQDPAADPPSSQGDAAMAQAEEQRECLRRLANADASA